MKLNSYFHKKLPQRQKKHAKTLNYYNGFFFYEML